MTAPHIQALVEAAKTAQNRFMLMRRRMGPAPINGASPATGEDELREAIAAFEAAESAHSPAPTLVAAARAVCDNAEGDDEDFGISAVDTGDLKALKSALLSCQVRTDIREAAQALSEAFDLWSYPGFIERDVRAERYRVLLEKGRALKSALAAPPGEDIASPKSE